VQDQDWWSNDVVLCFAVLHNGSSYPFILPYWDIGVLIWLVYKTSTYLNYNSNLPNKLLIRSLFLPKSSPNWVPWLFLFQAPPQYYCLNLQYTDTPEGRSLPLICFLSTHKPLLVGLIKIWPHQQFHIVSIPPETVSHPKISNFGMWLKFTKF
jgi:hypothetical protein